MPLRQSLLVRFFKPCIRCSNSRLVVGDVLWLWWFDRGGAIQSYGLDFVTDFPAFIVLLAILRRFGPQHWGAHPDILPYGISYPKSESQPNSWDLKLHGADEATIVNVTIHEKQKATYLDLFSRSSVVLPAKSSTNWPLRPGHSLRDVQMVAKISFPDSARENEADLLRFAYAIAEDDKKDGKYIKGHLPVLIAARDFASYPAKAMKEVLGLSPERSKKRFRTLRILLFQELRPISQLSGKDFIKAFRECFLCA